MNISDVKTGPCEKKKKVGARGKRKKGKTRKIEREKQQKSNREKRKRKQGKKRNRKSKKEDKLERGKDVFECRSWWEDGWTVSIDSPLAEWFATLSLPLSDCTL